MQHSRVRDWITAALGPALAAGIGSIATYRGVDDWYPRLRKPAWNPPRQVFGPVWTLLYIMMALADGLIGASRHRNVEDARRLNHLQLVLNTTWSVVFFGLRAPGAALMVIVGLWVSIVATIRKYATIDVRAARLLVPYLCWTSFATALNAAIWWKNRGRAS